MKHIEFWFDPISPFAYLAFERLPAALQGLSYSVSYRPVLFAAMLKHYGQLGPAEIAPKRDWTFRHVAWMARSQGTPLQLPAAHPFNPLSLLRLALAHGHAGACNRWVAEQVLRHVWCSGQDAADPVRLQALALRLGQERQSWRDTPQPDPGSDAVKTQLRTNTELAIARGIFGVPSMWVDDKLFWGLDALPMLRACLAGDAWFDGPDWSAVGQLPVGTARPR